MFDNAHPQFFKESDKTVDTFIRMKKEKSIKEFFLKTIDEKLKNYEPGEPKNKPDVLEQIKEIESKRDELIKAEMEKLKGNGPIMLQQPGQEPKALSNQEVVNIMQGQMQQLQQFASEKQQLENMVKQLQEQLMRKTKEAKIAKDMVKKLQQELKDKDETPSSTRMQIEVVDQIEDKNPFSKTEPENFVQIQGD